MKPSKSTIIAVAIGIALLAANTLRVSAQAVVPVSDLGTNADGTLVFPVPGTLDITNFNPAADTQFPDGLNYYEDNGGALNPGGQTFTAPSSNVVLTAVSLELGLDNGNALLGAGAGGTGPGTFWLRIYSVSGTTSTLVASYVSTNTFSFNAGDWLQWSGLSVPLTANGIYAYSYARDPAGPGWCQIYAGNGNSYVGGQACLIQAAGGANSVTYGTAGTYDGNFDLGLAPLTTPVATPPVFSPASPVFGGTPVTVSENAGGTPPLSYQWQTDNGTGGVLVNINAGTSSNVVVSPNVAGTYRYDVIVTNNSGSITSAISSLTVVAPSAPLLTSDINLGTNVFAFVNGSVTYSAAFNGTQPINYQWLANTTGSFADVGLNTNVLTLSNLQASAAGSYELTANNTVGSSNSAVSVLNVLADPPAPTPSVAYPYAVFTNTPLAYWRLNETNNTLASSVQAYDYSGNNLNATYGNGVLNNEPGLPEPGPQSPDFSGFEADNGAAGFINGSAGSHLTVPSLNLNVNTVTITAWINPNVEILPFWGLFMWRGNNGDAAGFGFGGTTQGSAAELGYTWNTNSASTWGYNSSLYPPLGQWSFVALTITPTNTSIYLYYVSGGTTNLLKSVQSITNGPESFNGGTIEIGGDPSNGDGRDFNGSIDEVSVFNHSLSESQLQNIFLKSLGASGVAPSIATEPANLSGYSGQPYQFTVLGGGAPTPNYQWQSAPSGAGPWSNLANGGRISGATSSTLNINNTLVSDGIDYRVVLANSSGSATSSVASLTLTPVPTNGQWTVNFAIVNGFNGTSTSPYSGNGILGTGIKWNALQTGATIPSRSLFMSDAPVYQDNGTTVSGISVFLNDFNWGYANNSGVGSIGLLGPYEEVAPGNFGGAPGEDDLVFTNVPNGTYNLALYGVDGNYQDQGCIFTVNGVVQSTTGGPINSFAPGVNTVLYTNVLVANGSLIVNCANNPVANPSQGSGAFNGAQLQLVSLSTPPTVFLTNSWNGSALTLSWPQGTLMQATNLPGPWVTNLATSPFTIQPSTNGPRMFYRVQVQ